jgi:aspartyl/asparaginyl beta-hydroxylase (cupin superfamily)
MSVLVLTGACLGLLVLGVLALMLPGVRKALVRPQVFPYTVSLSMRLAGHLMLLGRWLAFRKAESRKTSMEVIQSLRGTTARDLVPLRDSYLALDGLPTVERGKAALALDSVFDVFALPVHKRDSAFTHPLQTPHFYVPGVPARPFYDPAEFAFTKVLEDSFPAIRKELDHVMRHQSESFHTYCGGHGVKHDGWNNFYFYLFGKKDERSAALCPNTMAVLDAMPHLEHTMAMFAALNPHSGLPPHTGPFNGILRVHLPLIVPPGCELTVGGEARTWEEGKVMVFDDSFVHSVHNHSDDVRVVLFFSIYHPSFAREEVPAIQRFNAAWQALPVTRLYEKLQHRSQASNLVVSSPATAPQQP